MTHIMIDSLVQKTPTLRNEKGQSAIEFILTIAFALGVSFLFVNQTINVTDGFLVHYANYMAARTFLVQEAGVGSETTGFNRAERLARRTFRNYNLDKLGINGRFTLLSQINGQSVVFTGATTEFDRKLSSFPFLGGGEEAHFYSEALLGKEPFRFTCLQMTCAAMTGSTSTCQDKSGSMDIVVYDNGC